MTIGDASRARLIDCAPSMIHELEHQDLWLKKRIREYDINLRQATPRTDPWFSAKLSTFWVIHSRLRRRICYLKARWTKEVSVDTDVG